ncbi:hypothetical protein C5167_004401 [Papaver somniferum]|uniref:AT-hook motif nuclear-localized protein n=1 Tax=Papaver somniferum TaxID=3469 RepID=A0A4Y7JBI7_PAPSO|nr:AT-hook motif nuclear-localized protein 9-like [Papaver somniferum]RZC57099.1 hypothetical protein C5167_004401 [Papaver somniferum]
MDGREAMSLPGAPSYYMQHGPSGFRPLASHQPQQHIPVQSHLGGNSVGSSPFPTQVESTSGISSHGGGGGGVNAAIPQGESVKRKRGRPRKYGMDGSVSLALSPISSPPSASASSLSPSQKRGRGRPPGTGRKQQLASLGEWISGSAGNGFTPHIITIAVGEDIASKIMSFSQQGPRAVCILSANGAVSTVTLQQPASSGGSVTYEGRFEILCLSGTYLLTDNGGSRGRSGALSISLSSPDGRVIGGGVGGTLIAATPVQVIVGSFIHNTKTKIKTEDVTGSGLHSDIQLTDGGDKLASPPTSNTQHQNMTPSTTMSMTMNAGWPGSRSADMRGGSTHFDIDLTRG